MMLKEMRDSSHERKSKMIELRINNETLRKENYAKDREIRRLNKDIQQYELTLTNLRTEMTQGQGTCSPPEVIKKDAEVMAGMCCTGTECGDLEPVKDVGELLREETNKYRERIHKMELSLKSSGVKVRAVHKINLGLIEELGTLRRLCVAVDLERRDARLRLDLEGQIVKQMLKQLQQAKAKLQQKEMESSRSDFVSGDHEYRQPSHASMPVAKTRARRDQPALDCDPDFRGPEFEGNGDGMLSRQISKIMKQQCLHCCVSAWRKTCQIATSTPEGSLEALHDSDLSIISNKPPSPITVSDSSASNLDLILETCTSHQEVCSRDCDVHEQPTMKLENSEDSLTAQQQSTQRNNLETRDDHDRCDKSETSDRKRNKSITSDHQSAQRNKNKDQILHQLANEKVRRSLESVEDVSVNKPASKDNANKSEILDQERNESITSENQPVFCQNKTSGDTLKKSITSQVGSWLQTSNIDATSIHTNTTCLCWKKDVLTQIPHIVPKSVSGDLSQDEISSVQTQLCDCSSSDDKVEKKSLQSHICDCGSAKDSARVQKCKRLPSHICDCSSDDAKEGMKRISLQSQICECGTAKDSAGVKKRNELNKVVKVEEQNFNEDAILKMKPCTCTKLQCMKNVETGDQKQEKADVTTPVEKSMLQREPAGEPKSSTSPIYYLYGASTTPASSCCGTDYDLDSGGGSSCAGACEQYYRNKLMATLQILENKEETIRVQGSSLGVAEARIAALTERACSLRCELDQKARELNKLRKFAESCRVEKADISITAEMQEVQAQKNIVNTLQDNLSVIAELYRECFFETAKQEELIDMLRQSYLDVRLMDKDKTDKINRLQSVINTQKWSIEQCQDVVIEVETLKSEISNFLNSSNNDSGMWERGSETPDVGEELGDILEQLRQLQDMLTGDCICGLQDENKALKKKNEHLEMQLDKLRHRVSELEGLVSSSHSLGQQYQKQIEEKEQEFYEVRQRLVEFESANKERGAACETLTRQLQQSQVLLDDKIAELGEARRARAAQDAAVTALREQLDHADQVIKEVGALEREPSYCLAASFGRALGPVFIRTKYSAESSSRASLLGTYGLKKLAEASQWRGQLDQSQARVAELEQRLQAVCAHCTDLEMCCSAKERNASALQGQLEEAHARGAALCDESRRVTACVRHWMRRQRALAREQQEKIKMQESMLNELRRCVETRQNHSVRTSTSEIEQCCSNSPRVRACTSETYSLCSRTHQAVGGSETTFSRGPNPCLIDCESERPSCSQCTSNRQGRRERSSESEMASCSSAPVPPRRRKKLPPCGDTRCPWSPGAQHIRFASLPRHVSPTDELVERVEHLHEALAATQRRWVRPRQ
ncbi:hypothetical protein MSG28_001908 [Choristoneura fumiferana]|uniref:Uncharacterized protein n=1 Tax=Choristoneura fumiferana TaxID=7141 RepID=A0ACC0JTF9_CHOFU|nr:hypothetical protein MSG28_001908 [Choristoneura fumiferana]